MADSVKEFTDGNFEAEVINSDLPVLVDFWAVWCMPCKMVAPIVADMAVEYAGKIKVGKLDVDKNPGIAVKYGIRSIPSLLIFKKGEVAQMVIGAVPRQQIIAKIETVID
ncbi:MAG: thioredoxin [Candidatus Marinimicrobia bacterium CG_4_9_14_3_um_filter_48_9]|nr:MAG: thioredoxin [Candidatus Marinimicrobia bacterium CG_4_9_14_3_um_filter_48_9]